MRIAPLHPHEDRRLAALHRLGQLDTAPEPRFDQLTELAALLLGVPIALISFVDRDRQWFKSKVGLAASETRRELSFCAHAVAADGDRPFVVEDALLDSRFFDNPFVTGDPHIRFYAGQLLRDEEGLPVGSLCVIDRRPRVLDEAHERALTFIAGLVEREFQRREEHELIAALAESEKHKALILDTVSEGLVLHDAEGRLIEWNPAAERLLAITGSELEGSTPRDRRWGTTRIDGSPWDPDGLPTMIALRTGRPVLGEVMGVRRSDGELVWLRVNAQPVLDDLGVTHQVVTTFADVTTEVEEQRRRQELEDSLRRSEQTATLSLNALEQGVLLVDRTGAVQRINPAAERILGYSPTDLGPQLAGAGWEPYDDAMSRHATGSSPMARATESGGPVIARVVAWRRGDGQRRLLRVSAIPNVDQVDGMVVAFTDITDEHLAQKLLDATFEIAPVGLAVLGDDREILRCNRTFADQAGRSPAELIGTDVVELIDPTLRADASEVGLRLRSGETSVAELEQLVNRPDGEEVWVSTRLAAIPDAERSMAVAATFDITQVRRLIAELDRFQHLFLHANDIIVVIDRDGQIQYASPSHQRVLGHPHGYRHPDGILGMVHEDDREDALKEIHELIHGSHTEEPFLVRVLTHDESVRWMECVGVNLLEEPVVGGIVLTARDVTDRVLLTEQIAFQALHDPLTGLANRHLLENTIEDALHRAERNQMPVALCYIDLDGFKQVNDRLGHAAGDELIVGVADRICGSIREGDMAARIGGDEFVVVVEMIAEPQHALIVADRLRQAILRGDPDRPELICGASLGVAISRPNEPVAALMRRADSAMYRAKAIGGSAIELDGYVIGGATLPPPAPFAPPWS